MRNSKCRKSIKRPFLSTTMIPRCSSGSKMSTFYSFLSFRLHIKLTRVLWDSHALVSIKEGNVTGLPCKSGLLLSSLQEVFRRVRCLLGLRPAMVSLELFLLFPAMSCSVSVIFYFYIFISVCCFHSFKLYTAILFYDVINSFPQFCLY